MIMERACWYWPPPQVFVQSPQAPQPDTWQSMGQGWVLQAETEEVAGQAEPPYAVETVMYRTLVVVPPPHNRVQRPRLDHSLTSQSMGQLCVLHGSDS